MWRYDLKLDLLDMYNARYDTDYDDICIAGYRQEEHYLLTDPVPMTVYFTDLILFRKNEPGVHHTIEFDLIDFLA